MTMRNVRLDAEAEDALKEVREATGLSISEALKRGLQLLRDEVGQKADRTPYDVYHHLDLGPGRRAIGRSTDVKKTVRAAIKEKLHP